MRKLPIVGQSSSNSISYDKHVMHLLLKLFISFFTVVFNLKWLCALFIVNKMHRTLRND